MEQPELIKWIKLINAQVKWNNQEQLMENYLKPQIKENQKPSKEPVNERTKRIDL